MAYGRLTMPELLHKSSSYLNKQLNTRRLRRVIIRLNQIHILISSPHWTHLNLGYHIKLNTAWFDKELENANVDLLVDLFTRSQFWCTIKPIEYK